jgi:hypothetical protein
LSYDHRIIDGRESVGFLVAVKEALENPMELLLDNNPKKHLNCKFKHNKPPSSLGGFLI